jgi:hypothetical protein
MSSKLVGSPFHDSETEQTSMTARKQIVDDLYDRRFHNQPETGALGSHELAIVEAGRTAMSSLQKTLTLWLAVGEAIKVLRDKADRVGGRQTFKRLMAQNGFSMNGRDKVIDAGLVSHLLDVLARKADVIAWHEKLPPKQQREWSAPNTIKKHCPVFATPQDPKAPRKPSAYAQMRATNIELQEQLNTALKREDGDRFRPRDTAEDIATVLVGMFTRSKAGDIARRMLEKLSSKGAKPAKAAG